ncbi:hypothetical protein CEXT_404671 [Caerostris extrusa]|uniref:Uncharacterized protein n=1 Tax=Caerostris extrusa TaxID=172846 RepID=A0AAV4TA77_CAEEX|nr:hypothetical protein CEXT_404671 [Caerostris extrusa]
MSHPFCRNIAKNYNVAPILQEHRKARKHYNVAPILQEHWKELQCPTHSTKILERTTMSHPFYKNIGKNYNAAPIVKEHWKELQCRTHSTRTRKGQQRRTYSTWQE